MTEYQTHLTRDEIIKAHKDMWSWIAKQTKTDKFCYSKTDYRNTAKKIRSTQYYNMYGPHNCALCQYAAQKQMEAPEPIIGEKPNQCKFCIGIWPNHDCCINPNKSEIVIDPGLYDAYVMAFEDGDWKHAAQYAEYIRDLPLKPE